MIPLCQIMRNGMRIAIPTCRPISSSSMPLVNVSDDDGIAVMTLQRPKINSLNLELLQSIVKALDEVANNKPRGLILTSASPTVFSGGLDIMEFYKPDMKRLELFWSTLQEVWKKLFGFPYVTSAAVNGHAPAGGCMLALSCEYRAMVRGKYTIGINETALGLVAPVWFMDTLCHTVHIRQAEFAVTSGKLFTVDEAFQLGLVDDTAADKSDALDKCKIFIKKFEKIPSFARNLSKKKIREAGIKKMQENQQRDLDELLELVKYLNEHGILELYLQKLKQKFDK